jgi:hypothetical protein
VFNIVRKLSANYNANSVSLASYGSSIPNLFGERQRKRIDFCAGYTHVQDLGDGRATAAAGNRICAVAVPGGANLPVVFQSPMAGRSRTRRSCCLAAGVDT